MLLMASIEDRFVCQTLFTSPSSIPGAHPAFLLIAGFGAARRELVTFALMDHSGVNLSLNSGSTLPQLLASFELESAAERLFSFDSTIPFALLNKLSHGKLRDLTPQDLLRFMHENHFGKATVSLPSTTWILDADPFLTRFVRTMRLPLRILGFDVDHPDTGLCSFVRDVIEVLDVLDPVTLHSSQARQFVNDMVMHLIHQLDDTLSNVTGQSDSNLLPVYASHSNLRFAIKTRLGSEREAVSARRRHVSIHGRPAPNIGNGGGGGGGGSGGNSGHTPTSPGPPSNSSFTPNTGSGGPSSAASKGGKGSRTPRGKGHSSSGPNASPTIYTNSADSAKDSVATHSGPFCRWYSEDDSHYHFRTGVSFLRAKVDTLLRSLGSEPSSLNMSYLLSPYSDTSSALKFVSIVGPCSGKLVRLPCPDWFTSRKVLSCLDDSHATSTPALVAAYRAGSTPDFR
jgi:hypothetical protein